MNEDDSLIVKLPNAVVSMTRNVSPEEISSGVEFRNNREDSGNVFKKAKTWYTAEKTSIFHYTILAILGLVTWGLLFVAWGDNWRWNGPYFRLASVAFAAWASGLVLVATTGFPPLIAALLTGILARNFGYLDMREFTSIDMFLRNKLKNKDQTPQQQAYLRNLQDELKRQNDDNKDGNKDVKAIKAIYPVIILGKGSLGWDITFMKDNWKNIVPLGVIPWTLEVLTLAICMWFFFGHPFIWGLMFGTFYASVSIPVVMPTVAWVGNSPKRTRPWPQFVTASGGIDTALSVGMFGVFFCFIFSEAYYTYRYIKAALTLTVGVGIGIVWGCIAGVLPRKDDLYVSELRILLVIIGGIFFSFFITRVGWFGAGVEVLACNAVAAKFWSRQGWKLNNNPATTAYRVIWNACEPTLFAYTGTFFEVNSSMSHHFFYGLAILAICLTVRLGAASLMCFGMSRKERLFICLCWSPKTIVEAVLCPMAMNTLIVRGGTEQQIQYAEDILRLTIHGILFTTPFVFVLIRHFGPNLLKDKDNDSGDVAEA